MIIINRIWHRRHEISLCLACLPVCVLGRTNLRINNIENFNIQSRVWCVCLVHLWFVQSAFFQQFKISVERQRNFFRREQYLKSIQKHDTTIASAAAAATTTYKKIEKNRTVTTELCAWWMAYSIIVYYNPLLSFSFSHSRSNRTFSMHILYHCLLTMEIAQKM